MVLTPMIVEPNRSSVDSAAPDVWLIALTYWYLTGLLAALGLSFGFYLVKPAHGPAAENRDFLDAFTWMDGKWYKQIATDGYRYNPKARSNIAFFPVYPVLARGLIALTGMRAEVALLIVSNASLLAALAMLAFYVRARYPDAPAELADFTVLAAALFPTSCFFRLAYSESTFLLLAVLAMFAMLRRWPLWAIALVVGLATAARPVGIALLAPFTIQVWRRVGTAHHSSSRPHRIARVARTAIFLTIYLPLACWGLAAFTAFQWRAFDDPFAVFKAHEQWRVRPLLAWPGKLAPLVTLEPLRAVYDRASPGFWASQDLHGIPWFSLQFANPILFAAAALLIAFGGWRRWLSPEEWSLAALMLAIPYATRAYEMGMGSTGRFAAVVFPVYLVLGRLLLRLPHGLRACLLTLSALFMALLSCLYSAAYVVF